MVRLQIGFDPVGDRAEDELGRQLCQHLLEAAALHLTIADFAEKSGVPLEFVVDVSVRRFVQQLAEHP